MTKKLDIIVANPAGNTTVMVLTPTEISDYQEIAGKLLDIDFGKKYGVQFASLDSESVMGEQVNFILPYNAKADQFPSMNMCGLEFCGNATRAFAYYRVKYFGDGEMQPDGTKKLQVKVSGCDYPITAFVDIDNNSSRVQMPSPVNVIPFTPEELELADENPEMETCYLIDLDGISHLILNGIEATSDIFDRIKDYVYNKCGTMEAFGIMFINGEEMTPVVYVRDVDTTYFEGSCASGTTAAAVAATLHSPEGLYSLTYKQPAGILQAIVTKTSDHSQNIELSGPLELSDIISIEI